MNADTKSKMIKNESSADELKQYFTFILDRDIFGIEVDFVKEIIDFKKVFSIPRVPAYIKGVMNLRGDVIPVIDLSMRLFGTPCVDSKFTSIVIFEIPFEDGNMLLGGVIDMVKEVKNIAEDDTESVPDFGAKIRNDFIKSIAMAEEGFIILLNAGTMLDLDELSEFDEETGTREFNFLKAV